MCLPKSTFNSSEIKTDTLKMKNEIHSYFITKAADMQ